MKSKINFTAYVVASIDGRIAKDSKSTASWASIEDWNFFQNAISKFDVVVVGHNTYKVSEKRLKKRNTIVFTSKISKLKIVGSVAFINPEKENILNFFNNHGYKKVAILGGSSVYSFFLKNKLLNNLFVTIEPYVFTTGVPMFSGNKFYKYNFLLQSVKKLNKNGTILLKYKYGN